MVSFKCSKEDFATIKAIVSRAIDEGLLKPSEYLSMYMDVAATHANGCPLDLKRFLEADKFNLAHDLYGIARHIDRKTGHLKDHFVPRFHKAGE